MHTSTQQTPLIQAHLNPTLIWISYIQIFIWIRINLYSVTKINLISFPHYSWEINETSKQTNNVKVSEKKLLDPSLYSDLHQKWMGSILGQDLSSIQVLLKSAVSELSCWRSSQQTDKSENWTWLSLRATRDPVGLNVCVFMPLEQFVMVSGLQNHQLNSATFLQTALSFSLNRRSWDESVV